MENRLNTTLLKTNLSKFPYAFPFPFFVSDLQILSHFYLYPVRFPEVHCERPLTPSAAERSRRVHSLMTSGDFPDPPVFDYVRLP